jgi:hypothetical protein
MATRRIDGARAPDSLIERINTEDGVGEGLAQRTREDYARKIGIIANQIEKAGRGPLTPAKLVSHLQELVSKKRIAQSTARSLKAAAIFWIAEEAQNVLAQGGSLSEYEAAYKMIRELSTRELPTRTERTSSTKLKFFSKETLESLAEYAKNNPRAKHAGTLVAFIRANLLVGLRPAEWFGSDFMSYLHRDKQGRYIRTAAGKVQSTIALRVENAKTTHGRGNGDHREILLHGISDNDLAALMHFREIAQSFASKFAAGTPRSVIAKAFFKPLQQTMTQALKRMGHPKNQLPTTYSTRHQAVANAKYSGLSDREIAAMFGHISTATAKSHYGKKLSGWMKVSFRPSAESVLAVHEKNTNHDLATPDQRLLDAAAEWNRTSNDQIPSEPR